MSLYNFYCRAYQTAFKIGINFLNMTEPKHIKGVGAVTKLADVVKKNGHDNVLVVTDKGLMNLNLLDSLFESLKANDIKFTLYDETKANPTIDNVEEALKMYKENGCKAIIAFGGGSPMDCAKLVGARVARPNKRVQKMRGTLTVLKRIPTLYVVPTTAGTGSETTLAAVVTDAKTHEKYAIQDPVIIPKYAVLDPQLTVGLPPHITSTTGMDALTHAVEAYIGRSNTKYTEFAATKATRLIFDNIEKVFSDGTDLEARENMLEASYYAGVAFTRAYVGYVHAIAHNFGGMYGTPHGLANAVILPYVLDWFGASAYKRLAELADVAGIVTTEKTDEEKAKLFIAKIRELNNKFGIPEHLEAKAEDIEVIAQRALREGNPLYPVPTIMNKDQCIELIKKIADI